MNEEQGHEEQEEPAEKKYYEPGVARRPRLPRILRKRIGTGTGTNTNTGMK